MSYNCDIANLPNYCSKSINPIYYPTASNYTFAEAIVPSVTLCNNQGYKTGGLVSFPCVNILTVAGTSTTPVPITILPDYLPDSTTNLAYSETLTCPDGIAPFNFYYTFGTLPYGVSLSLSGVLSGVTTGGGQFIFGVQVVDSNGLIGNKTYSVNINTIVSVLPSTVPNATVNRPYNQTIYTTGGTGAVTLALTAGSVPADLSFDSATGIISGTPTTPAPSSNFSITGTDTLGANSTRSYSIAVNPPLTAVTTTLNSCTIGRPFNQTINTSGGTAPIIFEVSSGSLPANVFLNTATGALTGTPNIVQSFDFWIRATDNWGSSFNLQYTGDINPTLTPATTTLNNCTIGRPFNQTINTSGGTLPITFSLSSTSGPLPNGLTLDGTTGAITGTPTATGRFDFEITATDASGSSFNQSYTVYINPPLTAVTTTLNNCTIGRPFNQTINTSGGTLPITFSLSSTSGPLPNGLTLDGTTGAITGTPTATGRFDFEITATDASGSSFNQSYTVDINPPLVAVTTTLPNWTIASPINETIVTSGGTVPITFSLDPNPNYGPLPTGVTLNTSTGVISGTPSITGSFNFGIIGTDASGSSFSNPYSITINSLISITPGSLPATTQGLFYSETISATGGTGPYVGFTVSGTLPPGLSLNGATGVLDGTIGLSASGTYSFTVSQTDSASSVASQPYTIYVASVTTSSTTAPPTTSSTTAPPTTSSTTVPPTTSSTTVPPTTSSTTVPPTTSSTTVPPTTSSTTTVPPTTSSTTTAPPTTSSTTTSSTTTSTTTSTTPLTIAPSSLPDTTEGASYSQTISSSGGLAPYAGLGLVPGDTLPSGLILTTVDAENVTIIGAADTASIIPYSFTMRQTDAASVTVDQPYTITVNPPPVITSSSHLPNWTVNISGYSEQLTWTGGTPTLTWSWAPTSGASNPGIPLGLTLDSNTGLISGMPTVLGIYDMTITLTDFVGQANILYATITINTPPLLYTSLPDSTETAMYNHGTLAGNTGTSPLTFSYSGTLPSGAILDVLSGVITTPTGLHGAALYPETSTFTIGVVDACGATASQAYTVTVFGVPTISPAWDGVTPTPLSGNVNDSYTQIFTMVDGNPPVHFNAPSGLPSYLNFDTGTGVLSGTLPSSPTGPDNFTIDGVDASGVAFSGTYGFTVT